MIYTVEIEHVIKGLSESSVETVLRLTCGDEEEGFEEKYKTHLKTAKEKFRQLAKAYEAEVFCLVERKHEKNILATTGNRRNI